MERVSISIVKRRIQKLGGSSLIVTLPKPWAKRYGLDVGDTVVVLDEGDHIKIFPPDSRGSPFMESVRVKHNGDMPLSLMINCLYLKGYRKFVISPHNLDAEGVMKLIEEARAHPKVRSVSLGFNEMEISLEANEPDNAAKLMRYYNIKIQELLDVMEGLRTDPAGEEVIDGIVQEAIMIARTIGRTMRKHGISLCQPEAVEPTAVGELIVVPTMLKKIYIETKSSTLPEELIRRLKLTTLELFGGIAGKSTKRLSAAIKMIGELETDVDKLEIGGRGAVAVGLVKGLLVVLRSIAESSICEGASLG
ncbi:MAG: AbrB/MazE/SpoVT family DNA-binding domain-containing protein [Acidilobaceae archaeon]|nr:AbrB/MazE/SpoVT family DNA-binding domain-containing protein [Acidilobaceae archaeon]